MKIKTDSAILRVIFILLILKLALSYLNVELGWWQQHLTPNAVKFNPLRIPVGFTRFLEYLILPLLVLYLALNYRFLGGLRISLRIIFLMFGLNIITSIVTGVSLIESIEYTIKFSAPMFLYMCLIIHHKKHDFDIKKVTRIIVLGALGLTMVGILIFDPTWNHWKNWLPVYFASLHTHNYLLAGVFIGIAYYIYLQRQYLTLLLFFAVSFMFLYRGWEIRSALVFYATFIVATLFVMHKDFQKIITKALLIVPIVAVLFFTLAANFDLNKYSSGRVSMYEEKYEMLQKYTAVDYLVGKGRGADYITTKDWWYEAKNSHNDLLTFIVENGVPYALLFLALLASLVLYTGRLRLLFASVIFGYLFTSLLSNGIALRTTAGYVIFIILAFIQIYTKRPELEEEPLINDGNAE
ncbi:MAG: hypothetical protein ABJM06_10785 [Gilvibacter sp.]